MPFLKQIPYLYPSTKGTVLAFALKMSQNYSPTAWPPTSTTKITWTSVIPSAISRYSVFISPIQLQIPCCDAITIIQWQSLAIIFLHVEISSSTPKYCSRKLRLQVHSAMFWKMLMHSYKS